jgi:sulfite reductase (ferredoxin)
MNACGQHTIGNIGFHGSSIKKDGKVIPAMQVLLGGGVDPTGQSFIADKITKVPTKRIPQLVSAVLDYFHEHRNDGEYFNHFYIRMGGRKHFYNIVKPFADVTDIPDEDLMDWGQDHNYLQEIGVGECAGVILDMVGAIVMDAKEKLDKAQNELAKGEPADAIFYAYATYVIGAKAILLGEDIKCNTHKGIISDFQKELIDSKKMDIGYSYEDRVLSINAFEPTVDFATDFVKDAEKFLAVAISYRNTQQGGTQDDKEVITDYYTA